MTLIGYNRVSTFEQHPEAQSDRLIEAGAERVFTDKGVSGKLARRPQWDACLAYLRPGDTLITVRLDRIGRSVKNLLDVVADLEKRQVDLICLDQRGIDTTSPMGKMLFIILAAVAQFEHDLILERTKDGLQAARARGRVGGRKPKLTPEKVKAAREMYDKRDRTVKQIAEVLGVDKRTIYRHLEREQAQGRKA